MSATHPLDLISRVHALGCRLLIRDGELRVRKPRPAPPELEDVLAQIREQKPAVLAALGTVPVCFKCRVPIPPDDLLCPACYSSRAPVFTHEERRQHTIERLRNRPCSDCGKTRWHVTARGDSWCLECFEHGKEVKP